MRFKIEKNAKNNAKLFKPMLIRHSAKVVFRIKAKIIEKIIAIIFKNAILIQYPPIVHVHNE